VSSIEWEAGKDTPSVTFDEETGRLAMEGECYPENAVEFFQPIFDALRHYIDEKKGPLEVDMVLQYFNSSSSKCLLDLFEILDEHHAADGKVAVNWRYQADDEDIRESGEDFAEDLNLHFNIIAM